MPQHVQRGDAEDLRLAALEQRRAVHPRQDVHLGGQLPDVGRARGRRCGPGRAGPAAGPASWSATGTRRRSPSRGPSKLLAEPARRRALDPVELGLALLLAGDGQRAGQLAGRPRSSTAASTSSPYSREDRELGDRLRRGRRPARPGPRTSVRRNGLAASSPAATISSVGAVAPPPTSRTVCPGRLGLDHHDRDLVGPRSTRPATTMSKVGRLQLGVASGRRPTGPRSGPPGRRRSGRRTAARTAGWTSTRR